MSRVIITTAQGIGDLHWCYQKLAPYHDEIEFNVLVVESSDPAMQRRANDYLQMLPKYGGHKFTTVHNDDYLRVARIRPRLPELLGKHWFEYCVNSWLEDGVTIRGIDPGMQVLDRVELKGVPVEAPPVKNELCLFVAGNKRDDFWTMKQWAIVGALAAHRMQTRTIHLIGAAWDTKEQAEVEKFLRGANVEVHNHVNQLTLAESIAVMRSCRAFVGFQSGLNVLAENYDVPQLNVLFDEYVNEQDCWHKPGSHAYHSMIFRDYDLIQKKLAWLHPPE